MHGLYPIDEIAPSRIKPEDALCGGCDCPASDVGPLMPYRVTFTSGRSATVEYCRSCLDMIDAAIEHPGASYGAFALPTQIVKAERLTTPPADPNRTDWFALAGTICRPERVS